MIKFRYWVSSARVERKTLHLKISILRVVTTLRSTRLSIIPAFLLSASTSLVVLVLKKIRSQQPRR